MYKLWPKLTLISILIVYSISANKTNEGLCPDGPDCDSSEDECGSIATPLDVSVYLKNNTLNKNSWALDGTGLEPYNKSNERHNKNNTQVLYRCSDKNDLLVGSDVRQCIREKWVGEVPRCAINLMNETWVTSVEVLGRKSKDNSMHVLDKYNTFGAFTPPVAEQPHNCPKWQINNSQHQMWIIHLSSDVNVHYIRFKLYAEKLQEIWFKRKFSIAVYLNNIKGMDSTECEFNSRPNSNFEDNYRNNKQIKNYLSLEYECGLQAINTTNSVYKVVIEFSYLRKNFRFGSISLCDFRLYYFEKSCGQPDFPIYTQVRRSLLVDNAFFEQYEYLCNDNEHTLEGKTHIRCGINGKWMDEFPICRSNSYCKKLTFDKLNKNIIIEYEEPLAINKWGDISIPSGKMAKLSCTNRTGQKTSFRLQGVSSLLCSHGKWHGLSDNERPECVVKNTDVIPIPKRIIKILLSVLFICVLLILILVFLMVRARRAARTKTMDDIHSSVEREYIENDYDFINTDDYKIYGNIPHIYYSCDDLDSCYGLQNNSIYKDDLSDKFTEIEKKNSIYSNL